VSPVSPQRSGEAARPVPRQLAALLQRAAVRTSSTRRQATDHGKNHQAVGPRASDLHIKAGDVFARESTASSCRSPSRPHTEQTRTIRAPDVERGRSRRASTADGLRLLVASPGESGASAEIMEARSSFMIVMRVIPSRCRRSDKLRLPPSLEKGRTGRARHGARYRRDGLRQVEHDGAMVTTSTPRNRHILTLENRSNSCTGHPECNYPARDWR